MRTSIIGKTVATESISFQSSALFKEVTLAVVELKNEKKELLRDSELSNKLSKIIGHHTGLNITFNIGDVDPCVEIPMVNKNNVLINSFIRNKLNSADGMKMIQEGNGSVRGSVNLKTGMVSGIFSEVQSKVHLPVYMFASTKFDPEEISAIIIHELGHLFTYYEFMSRSVTTNQVLAGLAKGLDGSGTVEERESVLITVKKAMNLSELDTKELSKSTNRRVTEIVVISNIAKQTESELGSNVYDFSTWEYLSDQYAARQGAGRYIVTGLAKLYKSHFNISFRSLPSYLSMEALKATLIIAPFLLLAAGVSIGSAPLTIGVLLIAMDGSGDGAYDRPGARMKRVRDQIVENLKDKKLSKEDVENLTEDLIVIDQVLANVNDRRQFMGIMWDSLIPSARKDLSQIRLQKELEDIAVNDIFVKAAELKQLA